MSGIGVEATPIAWCLRRFTTKSSSSLVDPQNWELGWRRRDPGAPTYFKAVDTRQDRKACVESKRGAVAGHPSDGAATRIPKVAFRGVYPSIM
jgi:hypothetical protein